MKVILLLLLTAIAYAQNPETAVYPGSVATDKTLFVAANGAQSTLSAAITTTNQTALSVNSSATFLVPTVVQIDNERIAICSKGSGLLTVCTVASDGFDGRGFSGTTAATHSNNRAVTGIVDQAFHNRMAAEVKAAQTAINTKAGTIASGTATLGTSPIAANSDASLVTVSAPGVASTDVIIWTPNASLSGVAGYGKASNDGLLIFPFPTANNVNFLVSNATGQSITPGAVTLNWRVVR